MLLLIFPAPPDGRNTKRNAEAGAGEEEDAFGSAHRAEEHHHAEDVIDKGERDAEENELDAGVHIGAAPQFESLFFR